MVANQFRGFNLWIDGESYYGQIMGLELPDLETEVTEKTNVAGIGTQELPRLLNPMEATITTSGYYDQIIRIAADHHTTRLFQVFGDIGEFAGVGPTDSKQAVISLTGRVKNHSGGEMNAEDDIEQELTLAVDTYKHEYDGNTLFDISINPPRWIVNGADLLEARNRNLGII